MEPTNNFYKQLNISQKFKYATIKLCRRISSDLGKQDHFDKLYELNLLCTMKGASLTEKDGLYRVEVNNASFQLRKGSSDIDVFVQVVLKNEYQFIIDILQKNNISIKTMIDAGANIGLTSILFSKVFPELEIKAFEPDSSNYEALQRNIAANQAGNKVAVFNAGVTPVTGWLEADTNVKDNREWARTFKMVEGLQGSQGIKGYAVPDILKQAEWRTVDFLKMDIEGGEEAIFNSPEVYPDFLKNVNMIALEIHDNGGIRKKIYNVLIENQFFLVEAGELTFGIKKELLNRE